MIPEHPLRTRIYDGEIVVGSWLNTGSPVIAELLASLGFDFLTVDTEHAAVNVPQAQLLFQGVAAGDPDCAPLVRLPSTEYETVKRYLDAGAQGVIAPLVNTPGEAESLVNAVKYPPDGQRGVGFARSNAYGTAFEESVPADNDNTLICVQIEHTKGIKHVDDILAVKGVDAAFVGPYDLSASLNRTGEFDHPDVQEAIDRVREACRNHDVAPGVHIVKPDTDEARRYLSEGYRMLAYSLDVTMLAHIAEQGLTTIRSYLEDID